MQKSTIEQSLLNKNIMSSDKIDARAVKYKYDKVPIGTGSFSKVYRGKDAKENDVAIKIIDLSKLDKSRIDKFLLELEISSKISHENIVKTIEIFKTTDHWYIVNEFCNYGTFADLIKAMNDVKSKEKEIFCNYYFSQLRDAMYYLNQRNIIHRDLKPQNILLTRTKIKDEYEVIVKLADFGFARYFDPEIKSGFDDMISTICGSPIYMAPELLIDMKYNTKADLWSYGVIMYEFLYGKNPYNYPTNIPDLRNLIINKKIDFPVIYSDKCIDLLKRLLMTDPSYRISWNDFFEHDWFSKKYIDHVDNKKINLSVNCVEDFYKIPEKIDSVSDSDKDFVLVEEPKIKTYKEMQTSSMIRILSSSISHFFGGKY